MVKDVVGIRRAMKHPHSSPDNEESIGMGAFRSDPPERGGKLSASPYPVSFGDRATHSLDGVQSADDRPVGLIKWSFDDCVVEEVWNDDVFVSSSDISSTDGEGVAGHDVCFGVEVVTEGVPDAAIAGIIRSRIPPRPRTRVEFTTPVDFVSSQRRWALIYLDTDARRSRQRRGSQDNSSGGSSWANQIRRAFARDQIFNLPDGPVVIGEARPVNSAHSLLHSDSNLGDDSFTPPIAQCSLPDLRYSLIIRGLDTSLANILPRLESLQHRGFLNYSHSGRHGFHLSRSATMAKMLLQRQYADFLCAYVNSLTEGSPLLLKEMPSLEELVRNVELETRAAYPQWSSARKSMNYVITKEIGRLTRKPQTGVYGPHLEHLREIVDQMTALLGKRHDCAQVIRECVSPLFLRETLRSLTDVHFNALLTERWRRYGDRVVVGDLVVDPVGVDPNFKSPHPTVFDRLDAFEGAADHMNSELVDPCNPEWISFIPHQNAEAKASMLNRVREIKTPQEAAQYSIMDVVLPLWGKQVDELPALPTHFCNRSTMKELAGILDALGLPDMRLASPAGYRHVVAAPRDVRFALLNEKRGWDWQGSLTDITAESPMLPSLYKDDEGILRQPSPILRKTGTKHLARYGIKNTAPQSSSSSSKYSNRRETKVPSIGRADLLRSARREGCICMLQMTIPRGSALTSALREVIHFATVSPVSIARLLR